MEHGMKKAFVLLLTAIMSLSLLAGCGGSGERPYGYASLEGKWVCGEKDKSVYFWQFFEDGHFYMACIGEGGVDEYAGTYFTCKDGTLRLQKTSGNVDLAEYTLKGDKLTMSSGKTENTLQKTEKNYVDWYEENKK